MSTSLYGYGPHIITADGDYDLKCVGDETRPQLATISLAFGAHTGNVTIKSKKMRSTVASFAAQAYVKQDGTVGTTALAADALAQVDATGKDLRLTLDSSNASPMTVEVHLANEQ